MSLICADRRTKSIVLRGKEQLLEKSKKRVEDILKTEKEFLRSPEYIKQKKGVPSYLMCLSEMKDVQWPSYWKCGETQGELEIVQEPLDSQSHLYKEVEKLVNGTWEAGKAGQGNDATGLKHTKLVIKKIFLLKNRGHFKMYDARRKQICMESSVNQVPRLKGLQDEWEVKTRTLGTSCAAISRD